MEKERKCVPELFRGVSVPTFEDLRSLILRRFPEPVTLPKSVKRRGMVKEIIRTERIYNITDDRLARLAETLPKPEELGPFYRELLSISGITNYEEALERLRAMRRIIKSLYLRYKARIKASFDAAESRKLSREFVGRVISVLRRNRWVLDGLKEASKMISGLPCISEEEPTVVEAGTPQVGKSSLVRALSTAKPEVSPFPFTTKTIILGHVYIDGYLRIQLIDTPGILDRPVEELNPIERKALAALKHLPNAVLFVIDPRRGAYYSLDKQLRLLKSVKELIEDNVPFVIAINKIDISKPDEVAGAEAMVGEVCPSCPVLKVSALTGEGLDDLLKTLRRVLGI